MPGTARGAIGRRGDECDGEWMLAGLRTAFTTTSSKGLDMAMVMSMHWAGVTPEQYDTVRDAVGWEEIPAAGGHVHVARFDAQGLHVTDVWESQQAFETFFTERLAPAIQKAGITGTPETDFSPLHRRFIAPGISGAA
ncbi:hypothetical protein SAV31267_004000 [Streptomyces avermitilis]|uniref:ABM domain-containing protein n=3 Tax=Streptomyces avermitilis TaxID=33903 RepID=A0A4D4MGW4_STRAX|nr:hypothetical protein SAV31267_004000 [Streptomyces avermitilis]